MISIKPAEMTALATYIQAGSGIILDSSKTYLVENRLFPLLEELHLTSYHQLLDRVRQDSTGRMSTRMIDAISTNETYFFRDQHPFNLLTFKLLPDLLEQRGTRGINIWSSACSTGQELYSIAITLHELVSDLSPYRLRLLGTDISDTAIQQASRGEYTDYEVSRGMPPEKIHRYFERTPGGWRVQEFLRAMTSFRRMNLFESWNQLPRFDLVFCRNVAIYFSRENRSRLFNRIASRMNPGAVLIIGSQESLMGITDRFQRSEFRNMVYYVLRSG